MGGWDYCEDTDQGMRLLFETLTAVPRLPVNVTACPILSYVTNTPVILCIISILHQVCARDYVDLLMTWVEGQINNEELFPTSVGVCRSLLCTCFVWHVNAF